MQRSCQRHTQVFDLPVRRMISLVPTPSALNRTISARQTCLCGVLRSRASAFRRRRSEGLRVMEIPVRMRQTRMHSGPRAVAFLKAAVAYYASLGVTVERVMTDNGSCYKSFAFRKACKHLRLKHIRTKPYTPKTNGKAERFIQTSL